MGRPLIVAAFTCLIAATVSAQQMDPALVERSEQLRAALKANDAAKLASFYAADAVAFSEGSPVSKGRAAIQKDLEWMLSQGLSQMSSTILEASTSGDIGFVVGKFSFPPNDRDKAGRTGHYMEIWRRINGEWLIAYDTFSSEPPPKK